MVSNWRRRAAPIIAQVLSDNEGADEATIRRALREAYPFGPRQYWPYKVWLDECAKQRGLKPRARGVCRSRTPPVVPEQEDLFA